MPEAVGTVSPERLGASPGQGKAGSRPAGPRSAPARLAGRRTARPVARALLGVAVVLAGILVPLQSVSLPDPLQGLAGESPVLAQASRLVDGTPNPCPQNPAPWAAVGSDCILEKSACPESPLISGFLMLASVDYPDVPSLTIDGFVGFCEHRIVEPGTPLPNVPETLAAQQRRQDYNTCLNGFGGFAVKTHQRTITETVVDEFDEAVERTRPENRCRLIAQAACETGLHRAASNTCRAIQRRTWTCLQGIPTNTFNKCYVAASQDYQNHPACQDGSPSLVAQDCGEYVGADVVIPPTSVSCSNYLTGDPTTGLRANSNSGLASSNYWCEFNPSYLKTVCHTSSPPPGECGPASALCIKRASKTGGCDSIARTILCRMLQGDYADPSGTVTLGQLQQEGCDPCLILPFRAVPAECPDDLTALPSQVSGDRAYFDATHQVRDDFYIADGDCRPVREGLVELQNAPDCLDHTVCSDPPAGSLSWRSNHFSQLAVVNSPVTLTVSGIPTQTIEDPVLRIIGTWANGRRDNILRYEDDVLGDPVVRSFAPVDPTVRYSSVRDLAGNAECYLRNSADVRIRVEVLWPDLDFTEIAESLGANALDWWSALTTSAREELTVARGLNWLRNPTPAQIEQERQLRAQEHTEIVRCNAGEEAWCRWAPTRGGYYRLTAAAAWIAKRASSGRYWLGTLSTNTLISNLGNPALRTSLRQALNRAGITPAEAGLDPTLSVLLPRGGDNDWLYTSDAGDSFGCPANDVRMRCGGAVGDTANYTETTAIVIPVHEVRVATRTPRS